MIEIQLTFTECHMKNGRDDLIVDVTGVTLIPGNGGKDCPWSTVRIKLRDDPGLD